MRWGDGLRFDFSFNLYSFEFREKLIKILLVKMLNKIGRKRKGKMKSILLFEWNSFPDHSQILYRRVGDDSLFSFIFDTTIKFNQICNSSRTMLTHLWTYVFNITMQNWRIKRRRRKKNPFYKTRKLNKMFNQMLWQWGKWGNEYYIL